MKARGAVGWFDYGVVWIEFVPVWVLLVWEGLRGVKGSPGPEVAAVPDPPAV
jgi:hypothetical protein